MSTLDIASTASPTRSRVASVLKHIPQLSLATVGVVLLAVLVIAQAAHGFTDPDYWWHFKTGEYILQHHAVPHMDPFTATAAGQPWVAHEWLSEVLMYVLVRAGGYGLALVVFTASPVLALLLLWRLLGQEQVSPRVGMPVAALAAFLIAIYGTVRPQILSWLFFAVLIYALYAYRGGRIQRLWGLPPLFALWANLHLSFVLGLAIFALFVICEGANQWLAKEPVRITHPLGILILSAAASCFNPNGWRLLVYPLRYLPLQETILPIVAEWKTPDFHSYLFYPLLAAMLLLMAVGLWRRDHDLWPLALGLSTAVLALQSVRYVPIFAVAFVPVAGAAIADRWSWARLGAQPRLTWQRSGLHWAMLLVVPIVLVIALRPGPHSQMRATPLTEGQLVPVEAADLLALQGPGQRIFNQYEWGGYLTYRFWPQERVFIDGRNDMFGPQLLKDYVSAIEAQPGWQQILDRYGVTLVIIRADTSMAGALETNPRWRLAGKDSLAVVYVRQ